MGILSDRALMGRTPTAGGVFPNGTLLDLVRHSTGRVGLLYWAEQKKAIVQEVKFGTKRLIPPNVDPTILAAIQLPYNFLPAVPPTRGLFDDVCRQFSKFTSLAEVAVRQVAYFIFATWMADRIPVAPFLWVSAFSASEGSEFMQLLALFCRRSLLLSADSISALWTLPMYLEPTLLLDGAELTIPLQRFLHASNKKGIHCVKNGRALDLYCPKAICSLDAISDPALATRALQINLPPRDMQLPTLTEKLSGSIADTFQAKFLTYRLTHIQQIVTPDVDLGGVSPARQGLAESLAACIFGDTRLQSDIVSLLRRQDRETDRERSAGLEAVILEALLHVCHEGDRSSIRVSELAQVTNAILSKKGNSFQLSPESVGWKLRHLRFRTEFIGSGGKSLWLLEDVRRKIHRQAREYRLQLQPQDPSRKCPLCSNSINELPGGNDERNSGNLPEVV